MHTYSFERLEVWLLSRSFRKDIYHLTSNFPKEETFGLVSQMKRSVSSIGACLAEGSGKITPKDKAHYTNMAYTTTLETLNHLIAALDLDYISEQDYLTTRSKIETITAKLSALRKSQLT
ncbi:four helix bundle protein [Pedobacter terrae]|uniref:Four helix bundle protein n=1 Tax=Pedobacter terrae TaxID=405671 RepID=A0A1G7U3B8_9SPHI|nr:four helix bundle protein [Pedobacter terrae]SDG41868.1 four helix bundle protein [Pedobacter terrae]